MTQQIAVTGSRGLVGSALVAALVGSGNRVTRVVRGPAAAGEVTWDPMAQSFDGAKLAGVDAVVHLAGENIAASRWTPAVKQRIRDSRVVGTHNLAVALAKLPSPPKTLVVASAIGFYGDRGDELLDESSRAGSGFLAEVASEWEAATRPAAEAGIRVVQLRFGVILSKRGGALAKMLLPFKLGAGGRIGDGRQWWSWVALDDTVGAIQHALDTDSLAGPVNVVAPETVTNLDFTKTLGRVLHRPTIFPMPAFAARLALGEMADALLLSSIRVAPRRLLETGYQFQQPKLEAALRYLLSQR